MNLIVRSHVSNRKRTIDSISVTLSHPPYYDINLSKLAPLFNTRPTLCLKNRGVKFLQ